MDGKMGLRINGEKESDGGMGGGTGGWLGQGIDGRMEGLTINGRGWLEVWIYR